MNALQKLPDEGALVGLLSIREQQAYKPVKFDAYMGTAGNFTVVLIEKGKERFIGVAKRNPGDKDNGSTGLQIAGTRAYRAMRGFAQDSQGYSRQRPVSKKEAKMAAIRDILVNSYDKHANLSD